MSAPTRITRKHDHRLKGFTLLEMLVSAALLLLVIAAITQLSIVSADASVQALMTTESARYAQALVEEQVAIGYTNLTALTGQVVTTSYTPAQGKTITGVLRVIDTSNPPQAGTLNLGAPSVAIQATTTWNHTTKGPQTYVYQVYVSQPISTGP